MRAHLAASMFAVLLLFPASAQADFADHFARRDDIGQNKAPVHGKSRLLIIPVQVDQAPLKPFTMAATRSFFEGDRPNGLRNYYRVVSGGKFELETRVLEPVIFKECPLPADRYPGCRVQRGDTAAIKDGLELIRTVLRRVDAEVDFREFDINGPDGKPDGFVDMVGIVTNMPFGGIGLPVFMLNDGDDLAGGTGGPFELDGVKIASVAIGSNDRSGMVMLHELGHLLGLTDLYSEHQNYPGLHFSAMGSWPYDSNPPLFDAETRYRLGWTRVKTVSGTVRVTLRPAADGGEVYKLGTGQEYFLVENRSPGAEFDQGIGASGLAIFHVDRRAGPKGEDGEFISRLLNCVNCDPFHPYVMNVQSNGRFDWQNGKKVSDADMLFRDGHSLLPDPSGRALSAAHQVPSTNFYDGRQSGIRIEEIRALPDGAFEVLLTAPETTLCAESCLRGVCPESECVGPAQGQGLEPSSGCGCQAAPEGSFVVVLVSLALVAAHGRRESRGKSARSE